MSFHVPMHAYFCSKRLLYWWIGLYCTFNAFSFQCIERSKNGLSTKTSLIAASMTLIRSECSENAVNIFCESNEKKQKQNTSHQWPECPGSSPEWIEPGWRAWHFQLPAFLAASLSWGRNTSFWAQRNPSRCPERTHTSSDCPHDQTTPAWGWDGQMIISGLGEKQMHIARCKMWCALLTMEWQVSRFCSLKTLCSPAASTSLRRSSVILMTKRTVVSVWYSL